jgi:flagellar export protein FliJ
MFRLEKVLRWKEGLEREARARRAEIERRVESVQREIEATRARRERAPDADAHVEELAAWSRYMENLRLIETRLAHRLDELRVILEQRVREHAALRRDVKGLERLREKAEEATRKDRARSAQAHMDDVAGRTKLPPPGKFDRPARPIGVEPTREGAAP